MLRMPRAKQTLSNSDAVLPSDSFRVFIPLLPSVSSPVCDKPAPSSVARSQRALRSALRKTGPTPNTTKTNGPSHRFQTPENTNLTQNSRVSIVNRPC
ncbi:hypothetical protein PCASD_21950 [Puccinia coronata f. sp. avenae]|uniref:Uncharacterized protein n=1 Tax=Puccinia coronata f. sp. avenae TaxID=200324 RepID=A0A2N5RTT7_9BASI|nr:hypothetical protein PCASD_25258 [Puccinia coronata f. sp. avenae]PLW08511.1 hypothetical protein PCASD_21950 [Puccinia coronata f. sp. avenae]